MTPAAIGNAMILYMVAHNCEEWEGELEEVRSRALRSMGAGTGKLELGDSCKVTRLVELHRAVRRECGLGSGFEGCSFR